MFDVTLEINLRRDILDPAGRAAENSLDNLGFHAQNVRIGKLISFQLDCNDAETARDQATQMANALLANAVMEDYTIRISEHTHQHLEG